MTAPKAIQNLKITSESIYKTTHIDTKKNLMGTKGEREGRRTN